LIQLPIPAPPVIDTPVEDRLKYYTTLLGSSELAQVRLVCEDRFDFFLAATYDNTYLEPFHGDLARWLQHQLPNNWINDKAWVRVTLPRGHLKTSICTKTFLIWLYLRLVMLRRFVSTDYPDMRSMISSSTDNNAKKMVGMIRNAVRNDRWFSNYWPDLRPKAFHEHWSDDSAWMPRDGTYMEGTFESSGIGRSITGRHFNVFVEDDTISPKRDELTSEEYIPTREDIEKAVGWHTLIGPFMEPPFRGLRMVVGTRWAKGDLIEYVENEPGWEHFELPCVLDTPEGIPIEDCWQQGTPISSRHGMDGLLTARESMGRYFFNALYLNKPISSENQVFTEPFEYFDDEDVPEDAFIVVTVDPAVSQKESADFTAIVCAAHVPGAVYILDAIRGRWLPSDVTKRALDVCRDRNASKLVLEAIAGFQTFLPMFHEALEAHDAPYVSFEPITSLRNTKNQRIMGLEPLFDRKVVRFRREPKPDALINELLQFTPDGARMKHDDLIDALSLHLPSYRQGHRPPAARTREPMKDPRTLTWDDFHKKQPISTRYESRRRRVTSEWE